MLTAESLAVPPGLITLLVGRTGRDVDTTAADRRGVDAVRPRYHALGRWLMRDFSTCPTAPLAGKTTYMKACTLSIYLAPLAMVYWQRAWNTARSTACLRRSRRPTTSTLGIATTYSEVQRVKEAAGLLQEARTALS